MQVAVLMGSDSDFPIAKEVCDILVRFGVNFDAHILSAHRTPHDLEDYIKHCESKGCRVYICAAGKAAHLAGVVASHTLKPVIGIPLGTSLMGLDSLFSTIQMPKGVPVMTMGIDSGTNAAISAIQILALVDEKYFVQLKEYRAEIADGVRKHDRFLHEYLPAVKRPDPK